MIISVNVETRIDTKFDDFNNRWHGTTGVKITVIDAEFGPQVEEFVSDEIVAEDVNLLLELANASLARAVDMSNLLEDVDLDGGEDLTSDLTDRPSLL